MGHKTGRVHTGDKVVASDGRDDESHALISEPELLTEGVAVEDLCIDGRGLPVEAVEGDVATSELVHEEVRV